MVRSATNRSNKYGAKIDGDIIGQRYDATKKMAVAQQKEYFAKAAKLESQVKIIIDGAPSMLQHFYIAFAEEFSTKTIANERSIAFTKWAMRGLDWLYLLRISNELFGGVPELKGKGVLPETTAYYPFYAGQGAIAYDLSGHDNHGTITGGATWTTGKIGNCLSYDGINGTIDTNYNFPELVTANRFTISFWAKNNLDANSTHTIFRMWGGGANSLYFQLVGTIQNQLRYGIQVDAVWQETTIPITDLDNTEWHNYMLVWNGTSFKIYIDGVDEYTWTNPGNLSSVAGDMFIGSRTGGSHWMNGKIDELIVYSRVLSEAEVKQYYNLTKY